MGTHSLHSETIYLALGEARIKSGQYTTRGRWTAAATAWERSRREGTQLPIVFGDAQFDSGSLIFRARVESLEVDDAGTRVTFTDVAPLDNCDVSVLIKVSDGLPMQRDRRRGYSVVRTPALLHRASVAPEAPTPTTTPTVGARPEEVASGALLVPDGEDDELQLQRVRRHQSQFRAAVEAAWGGRCAITGVGVRAVLQAAHLRPYRETRDNRVENGILLRIDLHALWDEHLLGIHPTTRRIHVAPCLADTDYVKLREGRLRQPAVGIVLDREGLRARWDAYMALATDEATAPR